MRGKKLAILESRLGPQLADLVARRGGEPVLTPALAEVPDVDPARIAALVKELQSRPAKLAIFQTGVGTRALFAATDALGVTQELKDCLEKSKVVVRGPKPTAALRARGVRIDLSAADPFTTAEVLQLLREMPLRGERVIVQRYGVSNSGLEDVLRKKGAEVMEIATYRWSLPKDLVPLERLIDALGRGEIDAVVVTNAAQVHNLFELAERQGRAEALRESLNRALVASIGPVASAALARFQVKVGLEASPPKLGPLVAALDAALSSAGA
jgi:uroporphyrinogen-III synthase